MCNVYIILDAPTGINLTRINSSYICSADCNPPCDYIWMDAVSMQPVTEGSRSNFRLDDVTDELCVAFNNHGRLNISISGMS